MMLREEAKCMKSIVRGETSFEAGVPESFNVLVKEMQSLCLDVGLAQGESQSENPEITSTQDE